MAFFKSSTSILYCIAVFSSIVGSSGYSSATTPLITDENLPEVICKCSFLVSSSTGPLGKFVMNSDTNRAGIVIDPWSSIFAPMYWVEAISKFVPAINNLPPSVRSKILFNIGSSLRLDAISLIRLSAFASFSWVTDTFIILSLIFN